MRRKRRFRTAEQKRAIIDEIEDRFSRGLSQNPVLKREKISSGIVSDWRKQERDGVLDLRSRFAVPAEHAEAVASASPPESDVVEAVQSLVSERDRYREALIEVQQKLEAMGGRS